MEDLFEVVQKIQLKKYHLMMDKHDIEGVAIFALKVIRAYENYDRQLPSKVEDNDAKIFHAVLVQILQKIAVKKIGFSFSKKRKFNFNFTPAEFYALKKLIDIADFADLPLLYPLQVQLDTQ